MISRSQADEKFADLHLHTVRSDGRNTPEEVIDIAKNANLSAISITDHDTFEGYFDAKEKAYHLGLTLIIGAEFSSHINGAPLHILGYFFDPDDIDILKMIKEIKLQRNFRFKKMLDSLYNLGYRLDIEKAMQMTEHSLVGRAHIARLLVSNSYFPTVADVMTGILSDKSDIYIPSSDIDPDHIIKAVKNAGGVTSMAHPGVTKLDSEISNLVKIGLDGIEVYSGGHTKADREKYKKIAEKFDLILTGGSDAHGNNRNPAKTIGVVKIPIRCVDELRNKADSTKASFTENLLCRKPGAKNETTKRSN